MKNALRKIINRIEKIPILKTASRIAIKTFLIFEGMKIGIRIIFGNNKIRIIKKRREILLNENHYYYCYDMIRHFDYYHGAVLAEKIQLNSVVDYSKTSQHKLSTSGIIFEFPSLPESDESTEVYLNSLKLNSGEVVLDLGAYAGASAYFIAKAVGNDGLVVSLEPDKNNFKSLCKNIQFHNLTNVVAVPSGVWSKSTVLQFQAEGNMGSSVSDIISRSSNLVNVEVLSLDDVARFTNGRKINAIKMDIEGAELEVLKNAEIFLRKHHFPRLVIEPHLVDGIMNTDEICSILEGYGYTTKLLFQGVQNWPLIGAESRL